MTNPTLAAEGWSCGVRAAGLFGALSVVALCQTAFAPAAKVMVETGGVGIVGFEKIGSWDDAAPVIARWRASGRGWRAARWSLVVDFFFLAAYGFGLWLLAALVAQHARAMGWTGWAGIAAWAGLGFLVAAAFDVVENIALLAILYDRRAVNWPGAAGVCATVKFALVVVGSLVVITVSVAFLGPSS